MSGNNLELAVDRYRNTIRGNVQAVQMFDSIAPLLVSMLPASRLGDYHLLVSEGMYSLIYSIEAINKWILYGRTKYQDVLHPSSLAGSTSAATLHYLRLFLTVIAKIQIVLEIFAHQFGDRARLNMILLIEVAKAVARAFALRIVNSMASNSSNQDAPPVLLPNGGQYEIDVPASALLGNNNNNNNNNSQNQAGNNPENSQGNQQNQVKKFVGRRSGKVYSFDSSIDKYEASRSRSSNDARSNTSNTAQLSLTDHEQTRQLYLAGETLHIIRPVVYVLLLEESFTNGSKSWGPWIMSLAIDIASQACTSTSTALLGVSDQAKVEIARRRSSFMFYMMRNPVFEIIIQYINENIITTGENAGAFSNIITFIINTLRHYHKIHFYVSSS